MKFRLGAAAAAFLLLTACAKTPTSEDFCGSYKMTIPEGKEMLNILHDGTYSQQFEPAASGPARSNEGTWNYLHNENRIEFHGFMSIDKRFSDGDLEKEMSKKWDAKWPFHRCWNNKIDIFEDEDSHDFPPNLVPTRRE